MQVFELMQSGARIAGNAERIRAALQPIDRDGLLPAVGWRTTFASEDAP